MAKRDVYQWWIALPDQARRRLIEIPDGAVAEDLVPVVRGVGAAVIGFAGRPFKTAQILSTCPSRTWNDCATVQLERRAVKAEEAVQATMPELNARAEPLTAAGERLLLDLINDAATAGQAWQDRVAWAIQQP